MREKDKFYFIFKFFILNILVFQTCIFYFENKKDKREKKIRNWRKKKKNKSN